MIKAKRKPIIELKKTLQPYNRILNIGCGGCVSVCLAGGQKEVNVLNAELAMVFERKKEIMGRRILLAGKTGEEGHHHFYYKLLKQDSPTHC